MTDADTLARLVHAVDRLDWSGIRGVLADTVRVDYTELFGGTAEEMAAGDLVAQWQGMLPGFVATQHLLGPVVVDTDGESRSAHAHVRAWHYLPDDEPWVIAGHYDAELTSDGRISELTLRVMHVDGPDDVVERATERARSHPRS